MVLQDKYKRANSSRYRATHGGIQSNRQKAKTQQNSIQPHQFPNLQSTGTASNGKENNSPIAQVHQLLATEESSSQSFARRPVSSNLDRYLEPEPDPNQEPEPEIDLNNFIEKQRNQLENEPTDFDKKKLFEGLSLTNKEGEAEEDVDESFNHLFKHSKNHLNTLKKPTKVFIQDSNQLGLEELNNERKKADAARELIARFSGPSKISNSTSSTRVNLKLSQQARFTNANSQKNNSNANKQSSVDNNGSSTSELVGPLDDEQFLDEVLNDSSGTYGKFKRT